MAVEDFLEFRMCRACHAREEDLERMLVESNAGDADRIYAERDICSKITRLGVNHGDNDDAVEQVEIDQLMSKAEPGDPDLPDVMLHGTRNRFAH